MLNGYLTYNGITSTAAGVKAVEKYPALNRPRRKFTVLSIPGRTGDVIINEDAWEDYEQEYEIYAGSGNRGDAPQAFDGIMAWLHSSVGYCRLEDTYEPDVFRLAYYAGGTEVDNVLSRYGRATIKFMCQGKRWLKTGENSITAADGDTLTNPTSFASLPLITVNGAGNGTFTIGGVTVTLTGFTDGTVIDCEKMTVTDSLGVNANSVMALGNFPTIPAGSSSVDITGDITSLDIVPRWFTI